MELDSSRIGPLVKNLVGGCTLVPESPASIQEISDEHSRGYKPMLPGQPEQAEPPRAKRLSRKAKIP